MDEAKQEPRFHPISTPAPKTVWRSKAYFQDNEGNIVSKSETREFRKEKGMKKDGTPKGKQAKRWAKQQRMKERNVHNQD